MTDVGSKAYTKRQINLETGTIVSKSEGGAMRKMHVNKQKAISKVKKTPNELNPTKIRKRKSSDYIYRFLLNWTLLIEVRMLWREESNLDLRVVGNCWNEDPYYERESV